MTSLLLLKIIYELANFFDFIPTLLFKYFPRYVYFEENLDSANKFNNMTSQWRQITSLCQSTYAQTLEMWVHYGVQFWWSKDERFWNVLSRSQEAKKAWSE